MATRSLAPLEALPVELLLHIFAYSNDPDALFATALSSRHLAGPALLARDECVTTYFGLLDRRVLRSASPAPQSAIPPQLDPETPQAVTSPLHMCMAASLGIPTTEIHWMDVAFKLDVTRAQAQELELLECVEAVFRMQAPVGNTDNKSLGYWYLYYRGVMRMWRRGRIARHEAMRG